MTPSKGFVASLEILDPLLRVRWGDYAGAWIIERKANIPADEVNFLHKRFERLDGIMRNPFHPQHDKMRDMYKGVAEEYLSAKSGYRVVMVTFELSDKTYNMLCASDMQRYGGYSRFADELEQAEQRQAEERRRVEQNEWNAIHKETYDMLRHVWDRQSTKLANGEKDLFFLLHGKRRDKENREAVIKSGILKL